MSRAFINKGEQWGFCSKAGEHCMYAEPGKECGQQDCEHLHKEPVQTAKPRDKVVKRDKVVRREKAAGQDAARGNAPARSTRPAATKKSAALQQTTPAQRRRELSQLRETKERMGSTDEIVPIKPL